MAMVYATGHLSGAHLNPAVTLAFALTRHFSRREALTYIAAQLLGAIAAAVLLLAVWPSQPAGLGTTLPSVGDGSALVYEAVLTAFLMFVIMAVATDTRAVGAGAAIAIGGTVGLDALFGGPITGASMNPPARSARPSSPESCTTFGSTSPPRSPAPPSARLPTSWFAGSTRPDGPCALRLPAQRRALTDERGALRPGRSGSSRGALGGDRARRARPPPR